ncbi:hypothetical protein T265_01968 [Opisthorchis viverrini]|uniref:Uncharacterized protein n=1 Tax=Opisthorchis viverrini TaxID=6198 RepID=A0A074ZXR1_OPIVI|nr:hypothetical protein T265_01968 [Opisthorchis viverrini]KER31881.1 hypothetical protein T265_01968 [Opisthorchis viverrini]
MYYLRPAAKMQQKKAVRLRVLLSSGGSTGAEILLDRGDHDADPQTVRVFSVCRSTVTPFRCLAAMLPEGSMKAGILPRQWKSRGRGRVRNTEFSI